MIRRSIQHCFILAALLVALTPSGISAQQSRDGDKDPLLGPIQIEQLFDLDGWFGPDFVSYVPDRKYTSLLKEYLDGLTIKCFMGTWCDDSKIQVPRMLKVLQQGNINPDQFIMIGLDRNKRSPGGEEQRFHIEKVPTFVLLKDGKEIGRIEEEPIGTLEKDLIGLVRKAFPEKYPPEKAAPPLPPPAPPEPPLDPAAHPPLDPAGQVPPVPGGEVAPPTDAPPPGGEVAPPTDAPPPGEAGTVPPPK